MNINPFASVYSIFFLLSQKEKFIRVATGQLEIMVTVSVETVTSLSISMPKITLCLLCALCGKKTSYL